MIQTPLELLVRTLNTFLGGASAAIYFHRFVTTRSDFRKRHDTFRAHLMTSHLGLFIFFAMVSIGNAIAFFEGPAVTWRSWGILLGMILHLFGQVRVVKEERLILSNWDRRSG